MFFFFFKQKTAYEIRPCDWSSDVCSSDLEDLLQETLLAAWRGLERFDGRSSLRAWLYRIATNRCLNALRDRGRRPREVEPIARPPEPTRRSEPIWLEPYPDALLDTVADASPGTEARYE